MFENLPLDKGWKSSWIYQMGKLWGLTRGKDLDEKRKDSKKARKRLIFQIF